jgi:head-tail adaptor
MSLGSSLGFNGLGDRRTSVTVQAETRAKDAFNQPIPTWSTVATLWCRKRQLSGREIFHAQSQDAIVHSVLETQWPQSLVTIDEKMRCLIDGIYYGIAWFDNVDNANHTLLIYITKSQKQPTS